MRYLRKLLHPLTGVVAVLVVVAWVAIATARPVTISDICNEETVATLPDGTEVPLQEGELKTVTYVLPDGNEVEVVIWYDGDEVNYSRNLDLLTDHNPFLCRA